MAQNTTNIKSEIICDDHERRLDAFEITKTLLDSEALPALKKGLKHWDRQLRNLCAKELVRRLGGKSASLILPLKFQDLLYTSCSSEPLLEHEDIYLIRYLKRAKVNGVIGDLAEKMFLRTKHYADAEAKKAFLSAAREKKTQLKKHAQAKINQKSTVATKELPVEAIPNWTHDQGIPILKDVHLHCAEYVYGKWVAGRNMDDLYSVSKIPKRSGGERQIEAPCVSLKMVQKGILKEVFGEARHHEACHGFRTKHSIVTNASPHVGKDVVLNLDLKDFFPSITAGRVYGIYKSFVGENKYARFLTDVSVFNGRLPQGAPTSPMIANLACLRLDRRLSGLAEKNGMDYTRYADDLTFSGSESIIAYIPAMKRIIAEEGFKLALPKLRIHRKGSHQEVTGLTVNERVSVPRAIRRRLRAAVHTSNKGNAPTWKGMEISRQALEGHINFVSSIHPDLGSKLLKQVSIKAKDKRA